MRARPSESNGAFFLFRAIPAASSFGAFALALALAFAAPGRIAARSVEDDRAPTPFFLPSDAASNVEFADVPDALDSDATLGGSTTFSNGTADSARLFGSTSSEPIALSPIAPQNSRAVETVKLDAYTSRSPSSWATTSIREARNSVFQSVGAEFWLAPNGGIERGGVFETQVDATFGLPFFTLQTPLLISPTFAWTRLETPVGLPRPFSDKLSLFSQGLAFQYYFPVDEKLLVNANFNAFYNTDYRADSSSAWVFSGYAAAAWKLNPQTNLMFGIYRNEAATTWKTVPIGGVVWKPRDDFYLEAVVPYPKVAKRLDWGASERPDGVSPYWIYLSGDVAGNVWAFRGGDGAGLDAVWARRRAEARYFDYRICAGIESKTGSEVDWALEGGVAFARQITIETTDSGPFLSRREKPSPAGIVRFRVSY